MFRRRRREEVAEPETSQPEASQDEAGQDEAGQELGPDGGETWDEPGDEDHPGDAAAQTVVALEPGEAPWGPWDAADEIPPLNRVDFGSLQIPVADGFEIQLNIAEDQGPLVAVVREDSSLQVQAFAAAKSDGLWEEVRQEIAAAVVEAGGRAAEAVGPFGPELHVRVPGEPPQAGLQPIRFLGVDGRRWFLRGVLTGPAAEHPAAAAPFEEIFAGLVVVRGDHPVPPRDLLEISLPEEARKAMEEQMAAAGEEPFSEPLNPFERGPEITETR